MTSSRKAVQIVETPQLKTDITNFSQGDTVLVDYLVREGSKERFQPYEGVVIAKQNKGVRKTFTIRRSVQGIGVEQLFLLHSPKLVSITKKQRAKVRQSKLYYIRELRGKATRLKRKFN